VLVAEDVSLAHATALRGVDMPEGDVLDRDEVEAGVRVGGRAAAEEVDDVAARRLLLDGVRTDGPRRAGDHDGEPLPLPPHRLFLREPLRAFVGAGELSKRGEAGLVDRRAVVAEREDSHRARVDDPLDSGRPRRVEDVPRAVDVIAIDLAGVAETEAVARGDVEDPVAARGRADEALRV